MRVGFLYEEVMESMSAKENTLKREICPSWNCFSKVSSMKQQKDANHEGQVVVVEKNSLVCHDIVMGERRADVVPYEVVENDIEHAVDGLVTGEKVSGGSPNMLRLVVAPCVGS